MPASRAAEGRSTAPVAALSFGTVGGSWAFPAPLDSAQQTTPRPLSAVARSEVSQPSTPVIGTTIGGRARGSSSDGSQNGSKHVFAGSGALRSFSIPEVR